ncbi:MAG: nucleoside hydrolase [Chloroflexi bacterium]|nr:nucleoside hydrolase [Chloroflexota bacterium]
MSGTARRKVLLDTDPGVGIPGTDADDPIALLLALAHPALELVAVTTTFGNCPPDLAARCAGAVLAAAGRTDIPVAVGSPVPLSGELPPLLATQYAGTRGRPGRIPLPELDDVAVDMDAADLIIRTVRANPGEVTLIAIGGHTNLATALGRDPGIASLIAAIVFMGGALGLDATYGRGNITPVAECNIWNDPEAARLVFRSGIDLTMVSLDVTNPATGLVLTDEMLRGIDPGASRVAPLLLDICSTYLETPMFAWAGHSGCVLYDPLAVAIAADPAVGELQAMAVDVETRGELTIGQTVPVRDAPPNLRACVDVDGPVVVRSMLETILTL